VRVTPGTPIVIKDDPGRYEFLRHVRDTRTGSEWVDCLAESEFCSFDVQAVRMFGSPRDSRHPQVGVLPAA
jgi:hypothetical protein